MFCKLFCKAETLSDGKGRMVKRNLLIISQYQRWESNPHSRRNTILSRARLPVPPLWQIFLHGLTRACLPPMAIGTRRQDFIGLSLGYTTTWISPTPFNLFIIPQQSREVHPSVSGWGANMPSIAIFYKLETRMVLSLARHSASATSPDYRFP